MQNKKILKFFSVCTSMILHPPPFFAPSVHLTSHGQGAALQGWQRTIYTTDDFPVDIDTAIKEMHAPSYVKFCPWPSANDAGYNLFTHTLFAPDHVNATMFAITLAFALFLSLLLKIQSR